MTTQKVEPRVGDTLIDFKGMAIIHTAPQSSSNAITDGLNEEAREPSQEGVQDDENSKMMSHWNTVMCGEMKVPQGYQNVAVLIIKWNEDLDELKSADEVGHTIRKCSIDEYKFI